MLLEAHPPDNATRKTSYNCARRLSPETAIRCPPYADAPRSGHACSAPLHLTLLVLSTEPSMLNQYCLEEDGFQPPPTDVPPL